MGGKPRVARITICSLRQIITETLPPKPTHMEVTADYFKAFGEEQAAMAASRESLGYCETLIAHAGLLSILDAGSGYSSAFFHTNYPDVVTVDDDPFWAGKTTTFLQAHLNRQVEIGPITALSRTSFDLVFYDYGNIETRIYYFKKALELCRRCMYVDDMHVSYYQDYVKAKSKKYFLQILPATTDKFGRYGALIIK